MMTGAYREKFKFCKTFWENHRTIWLVIAGNKKRQTMRSFDFLTAVGYKFSAFKLSNIGYFYLSLDNTFVCFCIFHRATSHIFHTLHFPHSALHTFHTPYFPPNLDRAQNTSGCNDKTSITDHRKCKYTITKQNLIT